MSSVITLPHRSIPVLGSNPALRSGVSQDPATSLMNEPWYLALQGLIRAINVKPSSSWANIINVKDFGAKGDGSTDDTLAILTARASVPGPCVLVFPPSTGAYEVQTLTLPSDTTLTGGGTIDILTNGTTTDNSIFLLDVSNIIIQNLTITMSAPSRTALYGNIRLQGASNVQVLNCNIIGGSSTAIHVINSTDLLFEGNSISDTWADGIHVTRGSARVRIIGNTIVHTGDDGIGLIGYISDGTNSFPIMQDFVVQGNTIYNLTKSVGRGIVAEGVFGLAIVGNTVDTVFDTGILIAGELGTNLSVATHFGHQIVIANNTITNTGVGTMAARIGLFCAYARNVVIEGNTIYNVPSDGISLSFAMKDVKVSKNDVSTVGGRGIIAFQQQQTDARLILELFTNMGEAGLTHVGISQVQIVDNTIRKAGANSISLESESSLHSPGMWVRGNIIYEGAGANIFSNYCDNGLIADNQCLNAIGYPTIGAIEVGNQTGTLVRGNRVIGGDNYGIGFITSDHCAAVGNYVSTCAHAGIFSDSGCSYNFITGNTVFSNNSGGAQISVDNSISNTSSCFNNFGDDYIPGSQSYLQAAVNHLYGVIVGNITTPTNTTALIGGDGNPGSGFGATGWLWVDRITGNLWSKLVAGWQQMSGFFISVTGGVRLNASLGINRDPAAGLDLDVNGNGRNRGTFESDGTIKNDALTATRLVASDGSKILVSIKLDLSNASFNDISAFPNGEVPMSNGTTFFAFDLTAALANHEARLDAIEAALAAGRNTPLAVTDLPVNVTQGLVQP